MVVFYWVVLFVFLGSIDRKVYKFWSGNKGEGRMFFNKKVNSEEYEKVLKQISEIRADLNDIRCIIERLEQMNRSLRGVVNRKLYKEGEEVQEDKPKDLLGGVILPYNGSFK